ncbi:hypothetical protein GCM10017653_38620 [Ancylobacter defluvii]|uniref:Uncharacterized protein n=1 Tax=Ancylobacter defluvii TaxID=1282440 RepID=A0A9W6JYW5_9HYPH|nr:hypothetical protein GCM10017653_38620 [Ancylobacter defluvii]
MPLSSRKRPKAPGESAGANNACSTVGCCGQCQMAAAGEASPEPCRMGIGSARRSIDGGKDKCALSSQSKIAAFKRSERL